MKIRTKRCQLCGHKTGLLNTICSSCDSDALEIIVYEPGDDHEPGYVVTVIRKITTMDAGITWHYSLLENLKEYNIWYDGHEVEILKAVDDAVLMSAGEFTMYWNFGMGDAQKAIELTGKLFSMRPGLMDLSLIEIEFHDVVDFD